MPLIVTGWQEVCSVLPLDLQLVWLLYTKQRWQGLHAYVLSRLWVPAERTNNLEFSENLGYPFTVQVCRSLARGAGAGLQQVSKLESHFSG